MTVKIGMGGSALDLSDARVWGNQADKIMVGTGTSAVEVWSASPYPLTGTFEIVDGTTFVQHEVFSHTVVELGAFTVTVTRTSGSFTMYFWYVNGVSQGGGTEATRSIALQVGDTIRVAAIHTGTLNLSGTWSLVRN